MSNTYVALDIETTGFDPNRESMIEFAAIVFRGDDILEEVQTLINPGKPIPPEITRLTGIDDRMMIGAPSLFSVRQKIRSALSDRIIVGHNVSFDMSFLEAEGFGLHQHRIDTITLASILIPEAGRYGLEALVNFLNLSNPAGKQTHRALDDVRQTVELFFALRGRALQLDLSTLREITEAGAKIGWPENAFFEDVLAIKGQDAFFNPPKRKGRLPKLFSPPAVNGNSLNPLEQPQQIDSDLIAGMLRPGGNISRAFPNFEQRTQQIDMLVSVAETLNRAGQLLVEAGTGTGKSLAYLLPSAFWATQNERRVVISTATINLQDQLINKDIPTLQRILPFELRASVRKGRGNYLCTRLFQQMRHSGPTSADEMIIYAKIVIWLPTSETGDVNEISLRTPGERMAWARLSGENGVCKTEDCLQEQCPLHLTKRRAENAHILIVNHSLLLSDVANNNHILPPFTDLVIDEAHHLESAVTDGLSFRTDRRTLDALLDEILKPKSGVLNDVPARTSAVVPREIQVGLDGLIMKLRVQGDTVQSRLEEFFTTVDFFLKGQFRGRTQFGEQLRLIPATRTQPDYSEIEFTWDNLNKAWADLNKGLNYLLKQLGNIMEAHDLDDGDNLYAMLATLLRSMEENRLNLHDILVEARPEMIYWIEWNRDRISFHSAPLHIGPLVEEHIFSAKNTVIMTSATLRTAGNDGRTNNFDYVRGRLHAHDAYELAVGSPFDYKNNTLVYLVSDIPEPNQPGYQRYVEEAILEVAGALRGRTMVLFTAYSQLTQTAKAIEGPLAEVGITLLAQMEGASRQQLLDRFKQPGTQAVLLGTKSFWEGVDVPGEALQAVVIAKLPFDVPSDPIFAARSETFENSFMEYSIPEAILRFRQGFGRLNRRQDDEGVVIVLDKRLMTKRYGELFLQALPDCTIIRQRCNRIGELTHRWLNRERNDA
ncbi:MAG: DEAD/DEAH box helicase family protein [Chloroflexi bacterium]|nr:DEAD/DEAH box helicase family protein [Chloroflexota bacterium]MBP8058230.1 DEAD/DEAH box helicase family protein [Chloroflexota bacterium]